MHPQHFVQFQDKGYELLSEIVQDLVDSDRLDPYEDERVFDAVLMAPEYFWDTFIAPALDKMASNLRRGFEAVDTSEEWSPLDAPPEGWDGSRPLA